MILAKKFFDNFVEAIRKEVNANFDKSNIKPSPRVKISRHTGFKIDQKWLSSHSSFHIVFALLMNSVTWPVAYVFLKQKVYAQNPVFLTFAIFPLVALFLAYKALGELLNTTVIQIKSGRLSSLTRPVSFSGLISINTAEIINILVRRKREGKKGDDHIYSYLLVALLRNDNEKVILRAKDLNEALYIEKLIEEHLGIVDQPDLDQRIS